MTQSPRLLPTLLTFALAALPSFARAQENLELGKMWTFENPPLAYLEQEYGFAPTQAWLDQLRLASIRFGGGCSSSFVSPRGLIMTNHHCIRGEIAKVQGQNDWLNLGFYAKALEDEVHVPGLTVQQLVTTLDVTAAMNRDIAEGSSDDVVGSTRKQNETRILEDARGARPELLHQVVPLYQGAIYQLYSYKVFDDIRLVCSPHLQTAHFGGDPDNFTYPRFGIDFTFCRAYENDAPVDTSAHYFRWNTSGVMEGDLVFVTGSPGTTKRLLTYAQMEYTRDVWHPIVNTMIDNRLAIRKRIVAEGGAKDGEVAAQILSLENSQKALRGYYAGLLDPSLMAQKQRAEKAFQGRIEGDPALRAKFGDVWDKLAEVTERRAEVEPLVRFQTTAGHPVLVQATLLVRGENDRAIEMAGATISETAHLDFIDHIERAREWLQGDAAAWLGDGTATEIANSLQDSKLREASFVRELIDGAPDSIQNSSDPALVMARQLVPLMDANAKEHQAVAAIEEAQGARIGQALHAAYGNAVSPDATFTPRFSDGVVKGYPYNGTIAPWRTTFFGLYARNTEFDNQYPFDLPQIWLDRKDRIDMTRSVDMVSSNDIIGGNSGSPLVTKDLEVIGLVFDGNIEMLPNRYVYRGDIPRSVSVHVDAIIESLQKIYEADRVVAELIGSD